MLICLVFSLLVVSLPVKAQTLYYYKINSNGSVEQSTGLLERSGGNTYTFTGDIYGTLRIEANNAIVDGAGYIFGGGEYLNLAEATNVLIENMHFVNANVYTHGGCNNSFIGNYFDNTTITMQFGGNGTGNLVKHNTFKGGRVFYDYDYCGTDIFTENNFIYTQIWIGLAVQPHADYNYWSNYTTKYPNAKEVDTSGVWDTPYRCKGFASNNPRCVDYYPLVNPVTEGILDFDNPPTPTSASPSPTATSTATAPASDAQTINPTLLLAIIIAVPVAVLAAAAIIARKNSPKKP